jgi:hypothetical protein
MNKYKLAVLLALFGTCTSTSLLAQADPCGCTAAEKACIIAGIYPIRTCAATYYACETNCGVCVLPSPKASHKIKLKALLSVTT